MDVMKAAGRSSQRAALPVNALRRQRARRSRPRFDHGRASIAKSWQARLAQPHHGISEPAVRVDTSRPQGCHCQPTPAAYGDIGAG